MNPYSFLAQLAGIGLVAGTAMAMVKLIEKVWPKADTEDGTFEYIAVAGEFPPEGEAAAAGEPTPENAADTPNENPVDAPPAVPVTDPLKIADPADFQDWDELGCQG